MMYHYIIFMTPISGKKLDSATDKLLHKLLIAAFSNLRKSDVEKILPIVLSDTEITMVKKRIAAHLLLEMNYEQNKISESLRLTKQTLYRFKLLQELSSPTGKKLLFKKVKASFTGELLKDFLKSINISQSNFRRKISPF